MLSTNDPSTVRTSLEPSSSKATTRESNNSSSSKPKPGESISSFSSVTTRKYSPPRHTITTKEPKSGSGSGSGSKSSDDDKRKIVRTPTPAPRFAVPIAIQPQIPSRPRHWMNKLVYKKHAWGLKRKGEITLFVAMYRNWNLATLLKSQLYYDVVLGIGSKEPLEFSRLIQADGRVEEIPRNGLKEGDPEDKEEEEEFIYWGPAGKPCQNLQPVKNWRIRFEHRCYYYGLPGRGEPISRIAVARVKGLTENRIIEYLREVYPNPSNGGNSGWMWIFHALRYLRDLHVASLGATVELCEELDAPGAQTPLAKLMVWRDFLRNEGLLADAYETSGLSPPKRNVNFGR